ncbi:hypothetical protein GCM10022206_23830 [Streptomyces chiangmaiensis]
MFVAVEAAQEPVGGAEKTHGEILVADRRHGGRQLSQLPQLLSRAGDRVTTWCAIADTPP